MPERVVVFAGPTLHRELAGERDGAWDELLARVELRPPAGRGDLLAAAAERPDALVLLDGYYFEVPAVLHKEVLYALDAGVRVIGAASLGALRAAELAPLGMEGVGRVFEWYRDGVIDGDDEVALRHLPASHGYRPVSLALVELRAAVAQLEADRRLRPGEGARLIAAVKALPFHDREPERVRRLAAEHLNGSAAAIEGALRRSRIKARDARAAIEAALGPGPPAPVRPPDTPEDEPPTTFLSACRARHVRLPAPGPGLPGPLALETCHALLLLHPEAPRLVRSLRLRWLLAAAAGDGPEGEEPERVEALADRLERNLSERFGTAVLPRRELKDEAALQARAEAACRRAGGVGPALAQLAERLGIDATPCPDEALLALVERDPAAVPLWAVIRAALATGAARPAWDTAARAAQVARCLARRSGGRRAARHTLREVGAALWSCAPDGVGEAARRRGLFPGDRTSPGLREALELVAVAERLPAPINDYPRSRERLRRAPLAPDLALPGLARSRDLP